MDQSALVTRLGFTVVAACSAESMTYPIDIIKTRLQLQGELQGRQQASKALGAGRVAAGIVKNEGLKGLYAGLGPAVVRHVFYSGTRITVYESARAKIAAAGAGSSTSGSIATSLLLGLTAGGVGQLVAVPADLVKVRMQADGRLVAMGQIAAPRYQVTLVNLGELATYDQAKRLVLASGVLSDGPVAHAASSVCSGLAAAAVSTPADVIKTRIMNQDPTKRLYKGMVDCFAQSVKAEGLPAMWKGFFPTWARLAPWQLTFWVTYEKMRSLAGMASF
ncbi:mitochondrial carrier domain-containing protein [Dunaliella salina]|uniref:Mitochondrial carrier domain-containing protein n=1 Tax=Dunaliella salina TaxID=3046 RepID=A0ABQ7G0C6_DUNSA|nr:mitochondrial carrier domain-containing protein [Dunaliella salina]|eukprot:KAF5828058.1 mitochondrial carrier domain-containing protein [Dunaliella salina]